MLLDCCDCCAELRPSRLRRAVLVMLMVAESGGDVVAAGWIDVCRR
jgi:hypothetical protein